MSTVRETLTGVLNEFQKSLNTYQVGKEVDQIKENFEVANSTIFKENGEVVGGFKQVASNLTDYLSNVEGSVPKTVDNVTIAQLDVSAARAQLQKAVGASQSDLETIVGKASLAANGFLDVVISSGFPEALAAALKTTTNLSGNEVANVVRQNVYVSSGGDEAVEDIVEDVIQNIVGNIFPDFISATNQLNNTLSALALNVTASLEQSNKGFLSLIENTVEQSFSTSFNLLSTVTNRPISPTDFKQIVSLVSIGKIEQAALILAKYSDRDLIDLQSVLSQINNKASTVITDSKSPQNLSVQRTDAFVNKWREGLTNDDYFTNVLPNSVTAEVGFMQRDVTEIIVNFIPVPRVSIQQLHELIGEKYNIGFNNHFYIGYDAILYRGRPLEIEMKNVDGMVTNDHYQRSIVIGVNIDEKNRNHKFAPRQQALLIELIDRILEAKPGLQVFSAHDVGWSKEVGTNALDVPKFVKAKLGKSNLNSYNPKTTAPLTSGQLANYNLT